MLDFCNLGGSWKCECNRGYTGDGTLCTDKNECTEGLHKCDIRRSTCTNTDGSYTCNCFPGYHKTSDYNCVDIDECSLFSSCPTSSACQNTNGSYTCKCANGLILEFGRHYNQLMRLSTVIFVKFLLRNRGPR